MRRIAAQAPVYDLAFSPDDVYLATAQGNDIFIYTAADGQLVRRLSGHTNIVQAVAYTPDGQFLLSASADGTIRRWDQRGVADPVVVPVGGDLTALAISPDGQACAFGTFAGRVERWSLPDLVRQTHWQTPSRTISAVQFAPQEDALLVAGWNGVFRLQSGAGGPTVDVLESNPSPQIHLAPIPGQALVLVAFIDSPVLELRETSTWALVRTLDGQVGSVMSTAASADGTLVATGSGIPPSIEGGPADDSIRVWTVADGRLVRTIHAHQDAINGLAFSHDGRYLASGSADRSIAIWALTHP